MPSAYVAPTQRSMLEMFSSNTAMNVNKINYWLSAVTEEMNTIPDGSERFDFSTDLVIDKGAVMSGLEVTNPSGLNIQVTSGNCFANSVFIQIKENVALDVSSDDDYLFDDSAPIASSYVYVAVYFNTDSTSDGAEVGIIRSPYEYTTHEAEICLLAVLDVVCSGSVPTSITSITLYHPEYPTSRFRYVPYIITDCGEI